MSINTGVFSVNEKTAFLRLDEQKNPIATCSDGTKLIIPDNPWGRWYLRTHFTSMQADPLAAEWYAKHNPLSFDPIQNLLLPPREYQKLGINRMKMSNCALFFDMGLGKTFVSIAFSLWCFERGMGNVFLIFCPPTIFVSWIHDLKKFAAQYEVCIAHGKHKEKNLAKLRANVPNKPVFVITTYETLESIREKLVSLKPTSMYFDESSKVKNYAAKRTQSLFKLVNTCYSARRFCLSGTPSTKSALGLYAQFELLGNQFSGHPSYLSFEKRYTVTKTFMSVRLPHGRVTSVEHSDDNMAEWLQTHCPPGSSATYQDIGSKFTQNVTDPVTDIAILGFYKRNVKIINKDELHGIVQQNAYTLYKDQVLTELPPKTRLIREVEMTDEQKKAYADVLEHSRTQLEGASFNFSHNRASPQMKLHQIANGYLINNDDSVTYFKQQPKLADLEAIIEDNENEKMIIWAPFRPQIKLICNHLKALDLNFVELHGGTTPEDRIKVVESLQSKDGAQYGVINPSVGGMGLNLQNMCLQVFMSNWYAPDVRAQAEDRLWRIGQQRPVIALDIISKGTFEKRVLRTVLGEIKSERQLLSMSVCLGKETDE